MREMIASLGVCIASVLFLTAVVTLPSEAAEHEKVKSHRDHHGMILRSVDRHFLPHTDDFAKKSEQLVDSISRWCDAGGAETPDAVKAAYKASVGGWAAAGIIRIGPARKHDHMTRIAFWPDPRRVVRRQVRQLLANRDPKFLAADVIGKQSVAIQGLPALELLLYPRGKGENEEAVAYRCRLANAIAENVAVEAKAIAQGWRGPQGWRAKMLSGGPDNPIYKTEAEAAAEILKSLVGALQTIREHEILPWQEAVEKGKGWAGLPFEQSGLSKVFLLEGVQSVRELHKLMKLDDYARALGRSDPKKEWLRNWFQNSYRGIDKEAAQFDLPAKMKERGDTDTSALRRTKFYVNGLAQIIGREIAPAAGLFLGFNELDGD